MVSSKQNQFYIQQWLEYFVLQLKKAHPSIWPAFKYAITDYSRALLNSVSWAFNQVSLLSYVNTTHDWIMKNSKENFEEFTRIHLCYAHVQRNFIRILKKHYPTKNDSSLRCQIFKFLDIIANETIYEKVKKMWVLLSKICRTKDLSLIQNDINEFNVILGSTKFNAEEHFDDSDNDSLTLHVVNDNLDLAKEKLIYKKSQYYIDIQKLVTDHYEKTTQQNSNFNPFFNPDFMHEIERDFFSILSLWTFIVDNQFSDDEPKHFTNAAIESYYSEFKGIAKASFII